jgi:hypothetical protein
MKVAEVVPAFLAVCRNIGSAWREYLESWGGAADRGHFNDAGVIARYLVDSFERGDLSEFPAAFALLERCLIEGDDQAKELAVIGLLEDIQNVASHRSFGVVVFEPWLQPLSRTAWEELAESWRGVGSLADMLRTEAGAAPQSSMPDLDRIEDPELRRMLEQLYRKK